MYESKIKNWPTPFKFALLLFMLATITPAIIGIWEWFETREQINEVARTIPVVKVFTSDSNSDFDGDVLVVDFNDANVSPNVLVICRLFVEHGNSRYNFATFWMTDEVVKHKQSYLIRSLPFKDFNESWEKYDVGIERYLYTDRTHKVLPDLILHRGAHNE